MRLTIKHWLLLSFCVYFLVGIYAVSWVTAHADVFYNNVTASRVCLPGTPTGTSVYQNTYGAPIWVSVNAYRTTGLSFGMTWYLGSTTSVLYSGEEDLVGSSTTQVVGVARIVTFIVPINWYYGVSCTNSSTVNRWIEMPLIQSFTLSSSTLPVDNANLDSFLGILLFLLVVGWIARYFSSQIHG